VGALGALGALGLGLCRFGEAWAALWAENLLTYLAGLSAAGLHLQVQ
jgi:hypothetical protein